MNTSPLKPLNTPYLKMLLVDDEPLMRQGFRIFFDWEKYMISQVLEAESGIEAISISEIEKPDIIVSDIRMPEIDGLELIGKLKKILPKAVFIIISGYDDFDYAKQAISLGVFHYLVKPVHSAEFHEVMNKCLEKIDEQKRREKMDEELNNKLREALPALRNNYILNILAGNMSDPIQEYLQGLEQLEIDITGENYKVIMFANCNPGDSSCRTKSKMSILIKDAFEKHAAESRRDGKNFFNYYMLMDVDSLKGIISWNSNIDINGILQSLFERMGQTLKALYDIELICSSGPSIKNILDIHISAGEAAKILEYKFIKGQPGLWLFEDVKGFETGRPFFLSRTDQKKLLAGVENNDIESIKQIVCELNDTVKKLEYISIEYIYSTLLEMIISVTRFTYESGLNDNSFEPKILAYDYFRNFNPPFCALLPDTTVAITNLFLQKQRIEAFALIL